MSIPAPGALRSWRENPVKFVWDNFKIKADKWQERALMLFPSQKDDEKRIALQACAGPGKSAVLSWCAWNFLSCYGRTGEHPNGAVVSITRENLRDNLWKELALWKDRSAFLQTAFEQNNDRIYQRQHPETWWLSARGFPKKANPEEMGRTLSGLHSKFIGYFIDESGDIHPAVARAADQGLSTGPEFGKIMQAGNPTSLTGILYEAAGVAAKLWTLIRITGDPDDPDRSPRIDVNWAREQINQWGRDNPWVMSYILGLFPPASINALIGPDEVQNAMQRHLRDDEFNWAQKRLGVDAARFGDDSWCLGRRQGLASFPIIKMRNPRTPDVAARAANEINKWGGSVKIFADGTGGYGAGFIDAMIQADYECEEVQFGGHPIDPRFFNKRSEMIWDFIEWVKRGGALANDPKLKTQMIKATYTFKNSKLWVIEKELLKKELNGQSPDELDCLALTFAQPDTAKGLGGRITAKLEEYARPARKVHPFDDLEEAINDSNNPDSIREAGRY